MKCVIPEISYHNRDPVLSCDFQPGGQDGVTRLATGGSDTHVVVWSVSEVTEVDAEGGRSPEGRKVELEVLCDMTRHQRAVNIVRWSPDGSLLASGDDESIIIVWQMKTGPAEGGGLFEESDQTNKENWNVYKIIRFHLDDVYDLSWSPCGEFLLSGSVDNSAIVSHVHKNKKVAHFSDSRGFIQGVSWNKKHPLMSTLGSDRTCRTYTAGQTKKLLYKTYKASLNIKSSETTEKNKKKQGSEVTENAKSETEVKTIKPSDSNMDVDPKPSDNINVKSDEKGKEVTDASKNNALGDKNVRLFHDDTFKGFFRRLSWSQDGEILVVPSGVVETEGDTKVNHCTWVFTRVDLNKPALCLPAKDKYTIAVRFSPLTYTLRQPIRKGLAANQQPWEAANSLFSLPYRLVYAVATQNAVMFYDTQQAAPFARVSNIHYTGLTDVSWSPCGNILVVSSSDGYCSIITFTPGELGQEYLAPSPAPCKATSNGTVEATTPDRVQSSSVPAQSKPPASSQAESSRPVPNIIETKKSGLGVSNGLESPSQVQIKEGGKANPKRLQFITLSSPKAERKSISKKRSVGQNGMDAIIERYEALGQEEGNDEVEIMEVNDDLSLVLEESQAEAPPPSKPSAVEKKRVPLTTLSSGEINKPATPEKTAKGRRVNLITLSSPKS